ncbi:IS481 family transposase [Nocardia sp. NPDC058519]|uniref:IS481 family transposase n=1 Tax=Nocardia sp. NPDC058519 TaxID=3346535 RepID=UPI0036462C06
MDPKTTAEYRYRAVCEVLGGSPIGEVAARYGTTRQSVDTWRKRFKLEGTAGLVDRSRRPHHSPTKLSAEVEALICRLRREHPRWGARRISYELARRGTDPAPSRPTVHRVLVRNGLVNTQVQQHKRKYLRWQREAPMHLWQLDIVGGVQLADGRECKLLTGIDDHSRFIVVSTLLATPSAREVSEGFLAAMRRYGVPSEVLTDNGGQFTGRYLKPQPVEVLFERICRENGIKQRLTKPRSPTTTGKIERFHKTLRSEFLDDAAPFESIDAAQHAINGWVEGYNHRRPHQGIDMATPSQLFRPNGPTRLDTLVSTEPADMAAESLIVGVIEPPRPTGTETAMEFEARVPASGSIQIRSGRQTVALHRSMAGRTVTVWVDLRSIHISVDGEVIRTLGSRLLAQDLQHLAMRGARPAGPEPGHPAQRRTAGKGVASIRAGETIEIDRTVDRDGLVSISNTKHLVGAAHSGQRITLRLDGHLMHAIADNVLIGTWPCPIAADQLGRLPGSCMPTNPLPLPPIASGGLRAIRKVHASGNIMVAKQNIKLGVRYRGQTVTVVIEDTHFRILLGEEEIAVRPRRNLKPITRFYVTGAGVKSPDTSSIT